MLRARLALLAVGISIVLGGCNWSSIPKDAIYACKNGQCSEGLECRSDGFCHPIVVVKPVIIDSGCVSKTCFELGAGCGEVLDGCGAMLHCGVCNVPTTCGGSGIPNVCGCVPAPVNDSAVCRDAGTSCGTLYRLNGCGATLAIGCGSPCVCVGGPPANFCNDAGYSCGPYRVKDNCGREQEFNCGGCDTDAGKVCSRNDWGGVCGPCSSEDDLTFCDRAGANCGPRTAPDNCGVTRTVDCGACADGGACGSSGQANQCALQPNLSGCVTSAQCQSGTCGGGGLCCAAPLHACVDDSDCCRGSCAQNFCEPNPQ